MKTRILQVLIMVLMVLFVFLGCEKNNTINLGETSFSIDLPEGYKLTDDPDTEEDQIGYYYKDDNSLDFDVYAWEKESYVLKDEAEYFAAEYKTVANPYTINDLNGFEYISLEEYDGILWTVYNYMFEDENYILELCFWTNNEENEIAVKDEILSTLSK